MEKKSTLTIFSKLLIAMLVMALLPATGLWYVHYHQMQDELKANLERNLVQNSDLLAAQVDSWIDINIRSSRQIARTDDLISMEPELQYPLLKATDDTYEWSHSAFTTDTQGNVIVRSDGKPLGKYGDREYIKQILNGQQVGQQVVISRINGKPTLCMSVPIQSSVELVGVLVQCSKLTKISAAVVGAKIGKTGFAFLVDSKGGLIAHRDISQTSSTLPDFSKHPAVRTSSKNGQLVFDDNGKQVVAVTQAVGLGWKLIVQQEYAEAFAPAYEAKRNASVILGATVVVVALMTMVLAGGLAKPIRKLTLIADEYSRGQLDAQIPGQERGDEIGALARAIDRLGFSFKMALDSANDEQQNVSETWPLLSEQR
ncbi:MAG: cache domain-containing protein [Candidatus Tectomicrobia bacterium]|nr:cache domain-containing protein [Candidatus Tectomicrobia bacterium]